MQDLTGKIIKSLDFPHTEDHYMIGRVISHKDGILKCETILQMSAGVEVEIDEFNKTFSTGEPGTHWMEDKFISPRITVVG